MKEFEAKKHKNGLDNNWLTTPELQKFFKEIAEMTKKTNKDCPPKSA